MLAFLHTAQVHVATFEGLTRALDENIAVHHEVREDLLVTVAEHAVTSGRRILVIAALRSSLGC